MIAKTKSTTPDRFDLEDWLVSVLIDACDTYADPGELIDQMRTERAAATTEEIEQLARSIVATGLERGWLEIAEVQYTIDSGEPEFVDARTLEPAEAEAAIAAPCMWDRATRSTSVQISLTSTQSGVAHLDSLETEYE